MRSVTYTISQELLDKIMFRIGDEVLSSFVAEAEARTDYSGRGMYGKTCVGIVTDAPIAYLAMGLGVILADMAEADDLFTVDDALFEWYDLQTATDSMGLSTILYFPNLSVA
jgi:hypothetical protein